MTTHLPPNWRQRLLAVLGAPATAENLRLLDAWQRAEGGSARWNPLNSTYPLPFGESTSYNRSSVQNYFKPTAGIAAIALTLIQSNYTGILGALQAGKLTAEQIVAQHRDEFKTWGTNADTILRVLTS
jgi:hypothetical protein